MDFPSLTPELQAKAKNCTTAEELFALAKEEGYELTDEQLESIAGGRWDFFSALEALVEGCTSFEINNTGV